jgi:hypothetical protein
LAFGAVAPPPPPAAAGFLLTATALPEFVLLEQPAIKTVKTNMAVTIKSDERIRMLAS